MPDHTFGTSDKIGQRSVPVIGNTSAPPPLHHHLYFLLFFVLQKGWYSRLHPNSISHSDIDAVGGFSPSLFFLAFSLVLPRGIWRSRGCYLALGGGHNYCSSTLAEGWLGRSSSGRSGRLPPPRPTAFCPQLICTSHPCRQTGHVEKREYKMPSVLSFQ